MVLAIEVAVAGEAAVAGQTRNISIGGAFIDLEKTFAMGARVTLKVRVPAQTEPIEEEKEGAQEEQGGKDGKAKEAKSGEHGGAAPAKVPAGDGKTE